MKILLDMNLSPDWCQTLKSHGFEPLHWSYVGDPRAKDTEIMDWARDNGYILITHDLDFGALLAVTKQQRPSVLQIRTQNVTIKNLEPLLIQTLRQFEDVLDNGALIVVEQAKKRVRVLPL